MANNYCQFSFAIPLSTDEARAWGREVVDFLDKVNEEIEDLFSNDEFDIEKYPLAVVLPDDFDGYLGNEVEVDTETGDLWVHADESGTPDHCVPLIQEHLRRFEPEGALGFEWADTCSKPRLDEFGGGAAFVTANNVTYISTSQWLADQYEAHRQQQGGTDG